MKQQDEGRWARLRFAVVGPLLAAPPPHGGLRVEVERLARQEWRHPVTGAPTRFSFVTIERWYYQARRADQDPVGALRRRVRSDAGRSRTLFAPLIEALQAQYRQHPDWSAQLHYDNLNALVENDPSLGPLPSYATLARYMRAHGLQRKRRPRRAGEAAAAARREQCEIRSYETEYTHGLWHADFHHGSLRVLDKRGQWRTPLLLAVLDDHSRLACHLQWYLGETAQNFVHGLSQALMKHGLPRALMTDNGKAETAGEVRDGLHELGILHATTLPYSPNQNGKAERFWSIIEGRLLAMLQGVDSLSLAQLNDATQAWVQKDYNNRVHRELGATPTTRFLESPHVGRECPPGEMLRRAFRTGAIRRQRRGDGSLSLEGVRFEVPSQYRHMRDLHLRYASWDLSTIDLVDPRHRTWLCALYPLDKNANADGERRHVRPVDTDPTPAAGEMAPLLKQILDDAAATGLPPAFLPSNEDMDNET